MRERPTDQRIVIGPTVVTAVTGKLACRQIDRRRGEEHVGALVCVEQRADFALHLLVAAACVPQKDVALSRWTIKRGLQQLIDVIPMFVVHSQSGRRARDTTRRWRAST